MPKNNAQHLERDEIGRLSNVVVHITGQGVFLQHIQQNPTGSGLILYTWIVKHQSRPDMVSLRETNLMDYVKHWEK